jgi:hypothetical protein
MDRTMHRLQSVLDSWREDLQGQLARLDAQQLGFLAWELRRVAEAVEQAGTVRGQTAPSHATLELAGGHMAREQEEPRAQPSLPRAK